MIELNVYSYYAALLISAGCEIYLCVSLIKALNKNERLENQLEQEREKNDPRKVLKAPYREYRIEDITSTYHSNTDSRTNQDLINKDLSRRIGDILHEIGALHFSSEEIEDFVRHKATIKIAIEK